MQKIKIVLGRSKLEVYVPFMMAGLGKSLPSRKWNKFKKCWMAPVVRMNCEYIRDNMPGAEISEEARAAMNTCLSRVVIKKGSGFPEWYAPKTKPFSHQEEAMRRAYPYDEFALFMGCGTGKSKVAIDIATARVQEGKIDGILIVCPFSIRENWVNEINIHCPLPSESYVLKFSTKKDKAAYSDFLGKKDCVKFLIVGVESLGAGAAPAYVEKFVLSHKLMVVVDESDSIKNPGANRTESCIRFGLNSKYRMIMTGTPVTQGILDLYSQFEFLNPEIIGTGDYYSFKAIYAIMGGHNNKEVIGYQNVDQLMDSIKPYVYQVTTEEALPDLPPKLYQIRSIPMSPPQKALYAKINKDMVIPGGNTVIVVQNALEKMLRLQQVTGGHYPEEMWDALNEDIYIKAVPVEGRNPKVEEVIKIAKEVGESSIIVWCRFRPEIEAVSKALAEEFGEDQVVEFHGGVPPEDRWERVQKFESKRARFFVGNQMTGGVGLTLVAATYAIYFSNSFSYRDRHQSEARLHRPGQDHTVIYIDLKCEGTVDDRVMEAISNKQDVADYVADSMKSGPLAL